MLVRADNYLVVRTECEKSWLALSELEREHASQNLYMWVDTWCFTHDYRIHPILKQKLTSHIKEVNYEVSN